MTLTEAQSFLDLRQGFTDDDLKKAFRKKALQFHPDRPTGSKEKFQRLQVAKEVAEYHLSGRSSRTSSSKTYSQTYGQPKSGLDAIKDRFVQSISLHYATEDLDAMADAVHVYGRLLMMKYPWLVGGVTRYIIAARLWKKRDRTIKIAYTGATISAVMTAAVTHGMPGLMLVPLYTFMIWRYSQNLRWIRSKTIKNKPLINDFLK